MESNQRTAPGDETSWTLIRSAAAGDNEARAEFVRRYLPLVRATLAARWEGRRGSDSVEDGVQEVFVECFREQGVLERADKSGGREFRAFLFGVVGNVARRVEKRAGRRAEHELPAGTEPFADEAAREASLSRVFDRAWAESLIAEAVALMERQALAGDEPARRRMELLRLRFAEDLPMRRIAALWDVDAEWLQYEYARARKDFLAALREVIATHSPGSPEAVERACRELLALLD